ncbi:SDR family NAD(P)-dependent oxidoreductase [Micromonospora sp. LOL_023]|uniref:SDR family NAD(P)-dependent oxidoreductase n=1 Tax=Micromonospora sp. LOL_023 TaxID=3345418 RepID=UPI003A850C26
MTGSSSGIGAAIAARLAERNMRIVVNSVRSAEAGEQLARWLPDAIYVQADTSVPEQAQKLINAALTAYGRLDVLVNNAGTTRVIPHDDLTAVTPEVWQEILGPNLFGTWQMTAAAVPHLRAADGGGSIVNISSVAGSRPAGSSIPYAVSKAAVEHMTRLLAKALGPDVRVNAVAPALTETPWTRDDPFFQGIAEQVRKVTPLRRVGSADDVADAVLAVLGARHMTGVVLPVDGGAHLI